MNEWTYMYNWKIEWMRDQQLALPPVSNNILSCWGLNESWSLHKIDVLDKVIHTVRQIYQAVSLITVHTTHKYTWNQKYM